MNSTFYNEKKTKESLSDFILSANTLMLSMGEKCQQFEEKFAKYQGRRYAILFNSGSSANLALIQASINLGYLNAGDKVGFSAVTWATNVMPLIQLGLDPVPIDISLSNLNVCSHNLLNSLNKDDLKCVFITNLLGFCGDIEEIERICIKKNIILFEDNCESLGSVPAGKKKVKLGNYGRASTFSFFVGHHMSTIEGGMVCTDDKQLRNMLLMVRAHGWNRNLSSEEKETLRKKNNIKDFFDKYTFYELGYNLRPTEITGFLGDIQLQFLEEIHKKREGNFKRFYNESLKNSDIVPLDLNHMDFISNFAYPLVFYDKETFSRYLKKFENVAEVRPIVGGSIIEQPFFKKYLWQKNRKYSCPNAQKIHDQGFYFPNNAELSDEEVNLLTLLIRK
jgi:CDP-6-deoxy-D-xylo-4-hexulose-3-dehydrase